MCSTGRLLLVAAILFAACNLSAAQWEDCRTNSMVLTNGYRRELHMLDAYLRLRPDHMSDISAVPPSLSVCRFRNLEVTSYSRLGNNATTLDCLNKCGADQDCYSFNYDKSKKWCYISITEKTSLKSVRDGKYAGGYRKCIEHIGNNGWDNPAFSGGQE